MSRLLILSLGSLSGALLELAARRQRFDEIIVASRDPEKAAAKANNARIGAALEGSYPRITPAHFDMYANDAASRLRDLATGTGVIFAAPSMLPWWRLDALSTGEKAWLRDAPFATFMACHLAPMLRLRSVIADAQVKMPWIGASSPDVVNPVLARTGCAPLCGTGNVAEVIPKIALALSNRLDLHPARFEIRLAAQHAFEYYCYGQGFETAPPYLLHVTHAGEDLTALAREDLFSPYPLPYELDFNMVTVSATHTVLEALLQTQPVATHVPAPGGRIGGYPVQVSEAGVKLDLPAHWTEQQAIEVNEQSLVFDGIEAIDAHGTIHFTPACASAQRRLTGRKIAQLHADDAIDHARRLASALGVH